MFIWGRLGGPEGISTPYFTVLVSRGSLFSGGSVVGFPVWSSRGPAQTGEGARPGQAKNLRNFENSQGPNTQENIKSMGSRGADALILFHV